MISTTLVCAIFAVALLILLRMLWTDRLRALAQDYSDFSIAADRLALGFHEVCRSVLNADALAFLVKNAPPNVVTSFRVRQQQLARLSLRVANDSLLHCLLKTSVVRPAFPIRRTIENSLSKVKASLLLILCALGRAGLWVFQGLSCGIPRQMQLWFPAKVLSTFGATVTYFFAAAHPVATLPCNERRAEHAEPSVGLHENPLVREIEDALSKALPNDLSRMIYLATLRDNNTGGYFHPDLARRFTVGASDHAMSICHEAAYQRLVALELEDLTDQLDVYFAEIHVPKMRSVDQWKKLRAYRATIPIQADPISAEVLFMKIEVALAILEARLPAQGE
jgi:hypothetical protein